MFPAISSHVVRVLDRPHDLEHAAGVAVRGVDDDRVDVRGDESGRALERVRPHTDGGGDPQPTLLVLRRERVADALLDVLDGDQALEPPVGVDDRQLLDLVPAEDRLRLVAASSRPAR